jgi:hypothetical protein
MKLDNQKLQQAKKSLHPLQITHPAPQFPPLAQVTKPNVNTAHAAYVLDREQQTLRGWACHEDGPLRPIRINGRLAWPVSELQRVLSGG